MKPDSLTDRRLRDPEYYIPLDLRGIGMPGDRVRWRVEIDMEAVALPEGSDMTDEYFCEVLEVVIDAVKAGGLESVGG